jgi:3D (Asp-Asp-Asp) domain-containing protein
MPKCLNLVVIGTAASLVIGCATSSKPDLTSEQHIQRVRTTAYTHSERGGGGPRNALGKRLSGERVKSAASDWSRFPLGTHFRIASTNEEYIIDDYGTALIGTDTIDLYKTNRLAMKQWGVRHVDIAILEWGSEEESLKVLGPRCKHGYVQKMVAALEKKRGKAVAQASATRRSL